MLVTLRAKALAALAAVALLAAANVLTVQYLLHRSDTIAATLDVAGRMRMLAQRAGLQALAAPAVGEGAPLARYQQDFATAWGALRSGGSAFGLRVAPVQADLQPLLQTVETRWQHYQTLLSGLPATGHASAAQVAQVLDASDEVLAHTESLIDALVRHAARVQRHASLSTTLLFVLDLLLLALGYVLFTRHVLAPIRALTHQCRSMAQGRYVTRVTVQTGGEFGELAQALNTSGERIAQLLLDVRTEREALAQMQAMFDGLAQNSVVGIYMLDERMRLTYRNDRFAELLGYSLDELRAGFEARRLFPAKVWEQVSRSIGERLSGRTHSARYECKALRADGTPIDVEVFGSAMRLGQAPATIGMLIDIGQRKRAEASMRRANIVYQSTRDAIVVTDADGVVQDINPAFTTITGYTPADILGRRMNLLSSGKHDRPFYQAMWESLEATGSWSGDIYNRRKKGEDFIEHLEISTAYNDDGSVACRVGLFSDVTEERTREASIWHQAHFDHLTGLANRQMFEQRLSAGMEHARASGLPMALVFLDLDLFKEVNDTFGHDEGDALLQEVSRRLLTCVRATDQVARLGGDEFTLILKDVQHESDVARVCEKVLQAIVQPYELRHNTVHISVSAGIAFYPSDASASAQLLRHADLAMYASKEQGRNRFLRFEPEMLREEQWRLQLLHELEKGLEREQFMLHYQPIVEMATLRTVKAEALVRWAHPLHGMVSPAEFIPAAEESGLIVALGDWVFREAARQLAEWRHTVWDGFSLSVNVSPRQLHASEQHVQDWLGWLRQLSLPTDNLTVEITEGVLLDVDKATSAKMLELQAAGLKVALDDFGTGYSSLSYLKRFTIDFLKIDRSFVSKLPDSGEDRVLCNAIIAMAHQLGIRVIAEGVETREQHEFLRAQGCDLGQGYWYGRPMSADALRERLVHEHPAP
ncbi:MAG: diguanylate cyclase [Comamonas sp. SCN 67-35]|uniref:EAL domain-containing protein n=1 Tax=unclassified Comamonas TaxID=2638500 RepID=UPI00086C0ACC|nr:MULTISPECIES: EAL domain-containing protein [unclassified Comamonas]ODU39939.1 MAG: diguanylate cyclase [Comamonas sp. SCN 67-35]OJW98001.1 MAG: diguanylate cyclase [Burkholderiales bacterium 66-26]